ncbi:MAG: PDZ domain-containing protein [Caulobacter sp.]|nr:PDZ domain-containing protein [Caulobacter sp.]
MTSVLQSIFINIVPFLFVLGLVVVIHELGHFWAAKAFGIAIDQFSIGFGRSLVHWRDRSGVQWRIGWLPLGGYVRFSGDENAASVPDQNDLDSMRASIVEREGPGAERRYFQFKPVWQRAIVTAAGPAANFILAIVLFAGFLAFFGEPVLPARVTLVQPGTPAERAGLLVGDVIEKADGKTIKGWGDLERYIQMRANTPIAFQVRRGDAEVDLVATPVPDLLDSPIAGKVMVGKLGIASPPRSEYRVVRYNPVEALGGGVERTWDTLSTSIFYIGRIITGNAPADQIGSVVGIANTSGKVAELGAKGASGPLEVVSGSAVALLELAAVISVSLGFMNLLPLPVLDGGHLAFYAYEAVARRPLPARIQAIGYRLGLALLVGFMLFATWNDLQRLRVFNFLGGLFS